MSGIRVEDIDDKHGQHNTPPSVWGPPLWKSIHYVALGYPANPTPEERRVYRTFFDQILEHLIPCHVCRENYHRHLVELRGAWSDEKRFSSPDGLFDWTVALHNLVNRDTNKPIQDSAEMRRHLIHAGANSCPPNQRRRSGGNNDYYNNNNNNNNHWLAIFAFLTGVGVAISVMLLIWRSQRIRFPGVTRTRGR